MSQMQLFKASIERQASVNVTAVTRAVVVKAIGSGFVSKSERLSYSQAQRLRSAPNNPIETDGSTVGCAAVFTAALIGNVRFHGCHG